MQHDLHIRPEILGMLHDVLHFDGEPSEEKAFYDLLNQLEHDEKYQDLWRQLDEAFGRCLAAHVNRAFVVGYQVALDPSIILFTGKEDNHDEQS